MQASERALEPEAHQQREPLGRASLFSSSLERWLSIAVSRDYLERMITTRFQPS